MPDEHQRLKFAPGLHFEYRPDYLVVYAATERDNIPLATRAWSKIARECASHHYKRVLVIEDVEEILSPIELFEFVERMPRLGLLGITIAFVDLRARLGQYCFGETVGTNRGLDLKMFDNVAEAEEWLQSKTPGNSARQQSPGE